MKKFITIIFIAFFCSLATAQDDGGNNFKNVRFGINVKPSIDWLKPDGKIISGNGIVPKIGGGLLIEFRLAKVACIQTGLQLDLGGGKIKYTNGGTTNAASNTVSYYYSNSSDVIEKYNSTDSSGFYSWVFYKAHTHYQLNEREIKTTYISIPLVLKLKTKEIVIMTYFGQLGLNSSIRWKSYVNDKVTVINQNNVLGSSDTKSKVVNSKDVSLFNESLIAGGGVEMNLSGTTSLLIGLNFQLGFTNAVKGTSDYLDLRTNNADFNSATNPQGYVEQAMPQTLKTRSVNLTIGILF